MKPLPPHGLSVHLEISRNIVGMGNDGDALMLSKNRRAFSPC
jgi:hypothetical protein